MLNSISLLNYATGQKSVGNAIDAMVYIEFFRNALSYISGAKCPIRAWIFFHTRVDIIFHFLDFELFLTSRLSVSSRETFWPHIFRLYKTDT
jgi:uncharacterized membrane protein YpjA